MIRENEVFKIGKLTKPHGVKGEIAFAFEDDIFDRTDCPFLICCIDGIYVPFFIDEYRFKGEETALIKFEDIDDDNKARCLCGLDVFFPRSYYNEEQDENVAHSWNFFIGFNVYDENGNFLGIIESIDTSTINTLFVINNPENGEEHLIPAVDEFISDIDSQSKRLQLSLIDGLID